MRTFVGTLRVFTRQHVRFTPVLAVALSDQFLRAMTLLLIAKAVNVELPVAVCLIVLPLTTLVAIIPFSIAGYGGVSRRHWSICWRHLASRRWKR